MKDIAPLTMSPKQKKNQSTCSIGADAMPQKNNQPAGIDGLL